MCRLDNGTRRKCRRKPRTIFTATGSCLASWRLDSMTKRQQDAWRHGFTLIEMLVVMGLLLLLGAITFKFLPTVQEKQRVARGASLLQGWLATARNLAL